MNPEDHAGIVTFLFTDIEGSTRLGEQQPEPMRTAVARHDALTRAAVAGHRGRVVKMTGDGVYAAFDDPLDAVAATVELQQALADPQATGGVALRRRWPTSPSRSRSRSPCPAASPPPMTVHCPGAIGSPARRPPD